MPSIARFGRTRKVPLAENENADSDMPGLPPLGPIRAPRVSLPHVETQLNMHQYNGLFELDSPERQKGSVALDSSIDSMTIAPHHTNGSPHPTNGDPATGEWSSAVGHAATGKSGRVIHNLQEEIARLTRECTLYRSRAEETQRMNDAFKTQVQNMADRLRNLEQANDMNLVSISRKDKKMDELRAELQNEKDRRQHAENETKKFHQLMDEAQDDYHQKCAELQEIAHHSQTQYDVLAKAGQRERADQQRRLKVIRDEFIELGKKHEERNAQFDRLDSILTQKDHEIDVERENFGKLAQEYEVYRRTHDEEVRTLIEQCQQGEDKFNAVLASLKETEGQMRWVMQVKREVKGAE